MASLVVVPFDGGPAAQSALRAACLTARLDGTLVAALYVAVVPRQVPLSADLPWLVREVTAVQLVAEPIIHDMGANAWLEWVCAREIVSAISDVAAELEASQILLGIRRPARRPVWLRHWTLAARLERLAPCPVVVREFTAAATSGARLSAQVLS